MKDDLLVNGRAESNVQLPLVFHAVVEKFPSLLKK